MHQRCEQHDLRVHDRPTEPPHERRSSESLRQPEIPTPGQLAQKQAALLSRGDVAWQQPVDGQRNGQASYATDKSQPEKHPRTCRKQPPSGQKFQNDRGDHASGPKQKDQSNAPCSGLPMSYAENQKNTDPVKTGTRVRLRRASVGFAPRIRCGAGWWARQVVALAGCRFSAVCLQCARSQARQVTFNRVVVRLAELWGNQKLPT